jgi:hypothetical protein
VTARKVLKIRHDKLRYDNCNMDYTNNVFIWSLPPYIFWETSNFFLRILRFPIYFRIWGLGLRRLPESASRKL